MWTWQDVGTVLAVISYALGAAWWAAAMRSDVRVIKAELSFLNEFKEQHRGHGERITRVESRVDFHEKEIMRLSE